LGDAARMLAVQYKLVDLMHDQMEQMLLGHS
jgi:hypothetical protein